MRPLLYSILLLLLSTSAAYATADVHEVVASSGFKALILEDHQLPVVSVQIVFRKSGHAFDPQGQEGLSHSVSELLDEGSGNLSGTEFHRQLENAAISLGVSEDSDNFTINIKCLTEHLPKALALVKTAITAPHFDDDAIRRIISDINSERTEKNDEPETLAIITWQQIYYGSKPYGQSGLGTRTSLNTITPNDLKHFVHSHFTQDHLIISAAGDISNKTLKPLLDDFIDALPAKSEPSPVIDASGPATGSVQVIEKPLSQSVAIFGEKSLLRSNPDFYATYVLNYVIGGGSFESRLMKTVREDKGLAYTVYTFLNMNEYSVVLQGYVASSNDHIDQSVAIIRKQLADLRDHGVTQQELQDAKDYMTLSFALKLDSTESLTEFLTTMQLFHLGNDFIAKRNSYVNQVTLADVNRVAKQILDPDHLTVVIVGHPEEPKHGK